MTSLGYSTTQVSMYICIVASKLYTDEKRVHALFLQSTSNNLLLFFFGWFVFFFFSLFHYCVLVTVFQTNMDFGKERQTATSLACVWTYLYLL